ncbi:extracellular solute-binding protein [Vallitalea guaymasensis]|uniref:Extracellular solute-binding protein n=1 Tax=Vallitalea guaymasensis TaxID=1185412 RepID=A0A8J8SCZ0_9FIRM|nr:extracellular solute-binding protein [Vallitalea guaymasensis]QUH29905.1 extracellular solute-binding protein [Vallitalea guaymasensis]
MKTKKILAILLTLTLMGTLFIGCGKKDDSEKDNNTDTQTNSTTDKPEEKELEGSLISEKPQTFSIFLNFNNMPFNPEWRVWQEIAERTNISLEGVISQSNSNEEEAFNLMLSSGKLADIIGFKNPAELEKLGRDGGLIPLNDLIKEHAPNIQKVLDNDAKFRQGATALDGNIYYIPKNQTLVSAEFWWIRQDWLDKLDLKVPTTVDELYTVLTAFRNDDPNGNGEKDEIPLFDRAGWKMPDEYLYLWDTSTEFYPRDGKMTFEPMEENFKTGVTNLVKWYKEGLIDPEIFTRGAKSRDILYSANIGGMTHDWPSTGNYNRSLAEDIPGFNNVSIAPPANQNGEVIERTTRYPGVGWGISSQCKDPVTLIKFFDFMFTEEGSTLMNWGIEGETYTVNADGTKSYTDTVLNNEQTPLGYLRSLGIQYRIGMLQDAEYEYAFMTPEASAAAKLYNSNPQWFLEDMPPYLDGELGLKYSAEDEAEYKKIMSEVRPYVDEMFQKWLLGASDFEKDYDGFIKELNNRGIERAIEINQKAYDTFLGK